MLDSLIALALLGAPALAAPVDPDLTSLEAHHRELLSCDRLVGRWLQEDEYMAMHTAIGDSRLGLEALRPMPFDDQTFPPEAIDLTIGETNYASADLIRMTDHPAEADVREAYLTIRPHCMRLIGYF